MRSRGYVSIRGLAVFAVAMVVVAAAVLAYSVRRTTVLRAERRGIVALSPALTNMLFQIGYGDQVIGVAGYSHLPPGETRPVVGDYLRVNREQILRLRPAVIVTQFDNDLLRKMEREDGFRVERIPIETVGDILAALLTLDEVAGGTKGDASRSRVIDELSAIIMPEDHWPYVPRVLLTMGRDPIQPIGKGTFLDDLLTFAHGTNVIVQEGYPPRFNDEQIIALQPDIIIDVAEALVGADAATVAARRASWNNLNVPAARNGCVYVLNDATITIPDAHVARTLRKFRAVIHPEREQASSQPAAREGRR